MSEPKTVSLSPFRIAFRSEGENVNAYFAKPTTMDGAIYMGSFNKRMMNLAGGQGSPAWEDFQNAMRKLADACAREAGIQMDGAEWLVLRAPENERTGNA